MRASLQRLFCMLSLFAVFAMHNVRPAVAHDFPMKRAFDHVCHIDASSSESKRLIAREAEPTPQVICPLTTSSVALAQAYQSLLARSSRASTYVAEAARRLQSLWGERQVAPQDNSIAVAQPDPGNPPAPKTRSLSIVPPLLQAKKQFLEDYLPYDLCIRDWRFGRFDHATLEPRPAAQAAVPQAETEAAIALGTFLDKVEHWQCVATDFCSPRGELERWTESTTLQLAKLRGDSTAFLLNAWPQDAGAAPRSQSIGKPQFVVYETPEGNHVLLTVEQARSWQFSSASGQVEAFTDNAALSQGQAEPLPSSNRIMAQLSRQLHSAGNALLDLAGYVDSLADAKIASTEDNELR